jgi:hypothetical protein
MGHPRCVFYRIGSRDHFCGRHDCQTRAGYSQRRADYTGRLIPPTIPFLPFPFSLNWRAKRMDIESRHRFVPVAAFHTSRASLIERDPQALFLSPNHCARMDFVFRMNNQCESFRNGSVRPDVESDAGCR